MITKWGRTVERCLDSGWDLGSVCCAVVSGDTGMRDGADGGAHDPVNSHSTSVRKYNDDRIAYSPIPSILL